MRLDHLVYPVADATASRRFYEGVLGFPLVDAMSGPDWGGFPWLMMFFAAPDGRQLVTVALRGADTRPPAHLPSDARHIAFAVATRAEQDTWRARLTAANVELWDEAHGRQHSIYFKDPDGLVLEITTPPSDFPPNPHADEVVRAFVTR